VAAVSGVVVVPVDRASFFAPRSFFAPG